MIAVDTNILVYAHRRDSTWHERARACIQNLAERASQWAIPWPCMHEFLAIVTHPRVFNSPSTLDEAFDQVDVWLRSPSVVLIGESPTHSATLRTIAKHALATGGRMHDARIAAICIDHQVEALWTADRDFSRFPPLRVFNPLVATSP